MGHLLLSGPPNALAWQGLANLKELVHLLLSAPLKPDLKLAC